MGEVYKDQETLNAVSFVLEEIVKDPQVAYDFLHHSKQFLQLKDDYVTLSGNYDLLLSRYEHLQEARQNLSASK